MPRANLWSSRMLHQQDVHVLCPKVSMSTFETCTIGSGFTSGRTRSTTTTTQETKTTITINRTTLSRGTASGTTSTTTRSTGIARRDYPRGMGSDLVSSYGVARRGNSSTTARRRRRRRRRNSSTAASSNDAATSDGIPSIDMRLPTMAAAPSFLPLRCHDRHFFIVDTFDTRSR